MVTRAFNLKGIGVENDAHSTCIYMYDELSKFTGIGTNIREIDRTPFLQLAMAMTPRTLKGTLGTAH